MAEKVLIRNQIDKPLFLSEHLEDVEFNLIVEAEGLDDRRFMYLRSRMQDMIRELLQRYRYLYRDLKGQRDNARPDS